MNCINCGRKEATNDIDYLCGHCSIKSLIVVNITLAFIVVICIFTSILIVTGN
jgi:NMD protein affecting ribosome stability and mRNA decay